MSQIETCRWCPSAAVKRSGRIMLCARHKRLSQMRHIAKYRGKVCPPLADLESLVPSDMRCPVCRRLMNWFASDGRSTVISLQHDRSGDIRLMCHACNTRHAKMPGDLFYEVGPDKHRCPRCERILPLNAFWKDRSGDKWRNRWSYCKDCGGEINKIRYANRRADALLAELAKEPAP